MYSFMVTTLLLILHLVFGKSELTVHLIPHTHDDPGWLKTIEQYYYGSNNTIYFAGVQYILDTVTEVLKADVTKKFSYAEMSFFTLWYRKLNSKKKEQVKKLVKSGQLSFINGGWCMHDEASSHYLSMIDQTTLGHKFLRDELNFIPTVGWQIDPFGHSSTNAWLMSAEVGFDGLFFGRIDYQDRTKRMAERSMEMVWRGSTSLPDLEVLTGAFISGNYGPPTGFCFDTKCTADEPVVDDEESVLYNLDSKVAGLLEAIAEERRASRGNHIMLKMGSDFHYTNAHAWFSNLDKVIRKINSMDAGVKMIYSTPTDYVAALANESVTWPVKTDDFFPYADCEHCYWSGYFTSRPTFKFLERRSSSFLQTCRRLQVTAMLSRHPLTQALGHSVSQSVLKLAEAVGLSNHHDAITGTSKQHVADDYTRILDKALTEAETVTANMVTSLALSASLPADTLTLCRLYNESTCHVTQALSVGDEVVVVLYNALPKDISEQVTLFLSGAVLGAAVTVQDEAGAWWPSQLLPTASSGLSQAAAPWTLVFTAKVIPALSFVRFVVRLQDAAVVAPLAVIADVTNEIPMALSASSNPIVLSNDVITIWVDGETGLLQKVSRKDSDGIEYSMNVKQDLCYYNSFEGNEEEQKMMQDDPRDNHIQNLEPAVMLRGKESPQPSGAYIFRPASAAESLACIRPSSPPSSHSTGSTSSSISSLSVVVGEEVIEVRQVFSDWTSQVIRLRTDSPAVELEWVVGPIPIADGGKEVVSVISSDLASGDVFYTDSNGREYLKRVRDKRPTWDLEVHEPVAGNFYPITAGMYIKDEPAGLQMTVLTDRPQAATSLASGEVQLMVHRRLRVDDLRGVGEALDETDGGMSHYPEWRRQGEGLRVRGRHWLLLAHTSTGCAEARAVMDELMWPVVPFLSTKPKLWDLVMRRSVSAKYATPHTLLTEALPLDVQLVSWQHVSKNVLLLRLGNRLSFDEAGASILTVDLDELLLPVGAVAVEELSLSANQNKFDMLRRKVRWNTEAASSSSTRRVREEPEAVSLGPGAVALGAGRSVLIELKPMQIRTFRIVLS